MASNTAVQARKGFDFTQSHIGSTTLLERVEQLMKSYEADLSKPLDIPAQVEPLIDELFNLREKNLSLAREGLCRLLKLNVEEVQLELIRRLKLLFRLRCLDYDVENNQLEQL